MRIKDRGGGLTGVKRVLQMIEKVIATAKTGRSVEFEIVAFSGCQIRLRLRKSTRVVLGLLVKRVRDHQESLVFLTAGVLYGGSPSELLVYEKRRKK
jgi:hypothetical protein